jgi:hypothetical protein
MPKKIAFLHTASANVVTFDRLARTLAPDIPIEHMLDESLLADARTAGMITPELAQRIEAKIRASPPNPQHPRSIIASLPLSRPIDR